jgi:hypothetical protein
MFPFELYAAHITTIIHTTSNLMIHILLINCPNEKMKNLFINFLQLCTQIIYIYIRQNVNAFQKKIFEFCYWIIFQWPFFGKNFVGSTRINKIYFSYLNRYIIPKPYLNLYYTKFLPIYHNFTNNF